MGTKESGGLRSLGELGQPCPQLVQHPSGPAGARELWGGAHSQVAATPLVIQDGASQRGMLPGAKGSCPGARGLLLAPVRAPGLEQGPVPLQAPAWE